MLHPNQDSARLVTLQLRTTARDFSFLLPDSEQESIYQQTRFSEEMTFLLRAAWLTLDALQVLIPKTATYVM